MVSSALLDRLAASGYSPCDFCDAPLQTIVNIFFPEAQYHPSSFDKITIDPAIPSDVAFNLIDPELRVRPKPLAQCRPVSSVPK